MEEGEAGEAPPRISKNGLSEDCSCGLFECLILPHQRLVWPDCGVKVTDIVEKAKVVEDLQYDWRY